MEIKAEVNEIKTEKRKKKQDWLKTKSSSLKWLIAKWGKIKTRGTN